MQGVASVGGLISGIDVNSIIQKLSDVEAQVVQRYQTQQSTLRARQRAYQEANTRLTALKEAAANLSTASFFSARTATTDNPSAVTVSSGNGSTPGEYQITVGTIARAHQTVSQSYGDLNATRLGTGTFTVTSAGVATSITLDASNNTLGGLRDAINAANSNVRASIVQDGDSSYRLMIASKTAGTANALTVNSSLAGGTAPTLVDLQAATNATVTLGSGVNAINITRSTNSIRDLIPGVTLNLQSAAEGETVAVNVATDVTTIQAGVQKLVDQYNNALDYFNQQFKFNSETNAGGSLIGDYTLQGIQSEVQSTFSSAVSGLSGSATSLADVGISTEADGKLNFNTATFQTKFASDPDAVTRLFALTGKTTNTAVQFSGASTDTIATGAAYDVTITQAARQARVTAGTALTGLLGANENLTINGTSVALTAGMTQAQVIDAINARSTQTGVSVRATAADGTGTGNYLSFFSNGYGSGTNVSVVSDLSSGGADTTGVGTVTATMSAPSGESGSGTGAVGLDVIGTINGEAATGKGQVLLGNTGNANTAGLRLQITSDVVGTLGSVQVFGGAAYSASRVLNRITDTISGPLKTEQDTIDARISDIQDIIDRQAETIRRNSDNMRLKFNRMEAIMGRLQNQSAYLTSQLSSNNKS